MNHLFQKRRQRGVSIPIIAIAIAVIGLLVLGFTRKNVNAAYAQAGLAMGESLNLVAQAVDNYRSTNLSQLTAAAPTITGFASPMTPTVPELKTAGYLNTAVQNTFPDGNGYRIQILKQPAGCIGPSTLCNVYSIINLTNPITDDNGKLNINRLGALTAAVQDPASYSAQPTPANITGGNGAWTIPNPDAGQRAGIVVVVAGLGGSGTQWLRVGDPRDPSFGNSTSTNTYLKPSNGIGETVVAGTACVDPSGAIRNDTAGRVLSCQNGFWTAADGSKSIALRPPTGGVAGGTSFVLDTCAPGGTPWATYAAQISAVNVTVSPPYQVLTYTVTQSGGNWVTLTQATKPPAAPVTVNGSSSILGVVPLGVFQSGCSY